MFQVVVFSCANAFARFDVTDLSAFTVPSTVGHQYYQVMLTYSIINPSYILVQKTIEKVLKRNCVG